MSKYKFNTTKQISKNMKIQSHGKSKTEDLLAHALWKEGIRYRRNYKALPGKPDIAITKYKIAIFVDGEFWHGFNSFWLAILILNTSEFIVLNPL